MTEKKPRPRGQVEPLGAGKFRVRVPLQEQGPNGRARTHSEMLYNSTPQKAAKRRDKLMAQIDAGLFFSPAPLTVKALSEEWMAQQKRKSLAITTVFNYQDTLNFYVLPHVGHLQLKDLQPKALERMFNALQDRALADATIRHARAICKLIIRYAIWKKYLKENPLEGLELPKGAEARDTKSLTPEEARTLVETALLDLDDLIFVFALFTGMRPKECLGLPLSNVELLEEGYALARVTQQAVKLRRGAGHVFPKPKTAKGIRDVLFGAWLYHELMRLKQANEARARVVGAGWTDYGLVFPGRTGKPISEEWLRGMFARLLKKAGLPNHFTPHSLRHTYNTRLDAAGVSAKARCMLMGHASEDFNQRVYVKASSDMFEGVVQKLEKQIFGDIRTPFAPSEGTRIM